jgi:hypothetical protein
LRPCSNALASPAARDATGKLHGTTTCVSNPSFGKAGDGSDQLPDLRLAIQRHSMAAAKSSPLPRAPPPPSPTTGGLSPTLGSGPFQSGWRLGHWRVTGMRGAVLVFVCGVAVGCLATAVLLPTAPPSCGDDVPGSHSATTAVLAPPNSSGAPESIIAPSPPHNANNSATAAALVEPELCEAKQSGLGASHPELATARACVLMLYAFLALAIVCDEFFVPALNLLCEELSVPDDVAGATFMAAGASSPELFAALIGVLKHSSVGAGRPIHPHREFSVSCLRDVLTQRVVLVPGGGGDWQVPAR